MRLRVIEETRHCYWRTVRSRDSNAACCVYCAMLQRSPPRLLSGFSPGLLSSRHRHALLSCAHAYILNTWAELAELGNNAQRAAVFYTEDRDGPNNLIYILYVTQSGSSALGFISFLLHSFCSHCTVEYNIKHFIDH